MARIGEQGQGSREDAADDLGDHEAARQQRGDPDAALVGRVPVMVRVTVPGVGVIVVVVRVSVGVLHAANGNTRELTDPPYAGIMTAG